MSDKVLKGYADNSITVNPDKREVLAIISTDAIDRDGEVVSARGMNKKDYAANPVVMLNHDYSSLPIGKCLWVKSDVDENGRGVIKAKYQIHDKTPEARAVYDLMKEGYLTSHSIGFVSNRRSVPSTQEKNLRPELKDAKLIHRDWNLLEFSVVNIPCNPQAVALAKSKGYGADIIRKIFTAVEGIEERTAETPITVVEAKAIDYGTIARYVKALNVSEIVSRLK